MTLDQGKHESATTDRFRRVFPLAGCRGEFSVTRDEAAFLLGVPVTADSETVRHAWRMWARIAHPDVNGDPAHFAQLDEARRVLLHAVPAAAPVITAVPRTSLSHVVGMPTHPFGLALSGIVTILLAALAGLSPLPYAVAVATSSLAAALWAVWATSEILSKCADRGHRIATLALVWLPMVVTQVLVSVLVGTSFVPVLPLLALPFVAVVALVNPGAGLWRPVGRDATCSMGRWEQ